MNNKLKVLIAGAALVTLSGATTTASANDRISFSITISSPGYAYAPAPAYVYAPPPVYYSPRVVYGPPGVMYAPQHVYYSAPQWRGRDDRHRGPRDHGGRGGHRDWR